MSNAVTHGTSFARSASKRTVADGVRLGFVFLRREGSAMGKRASEGRPWRGMAGLTLVEVIVLLLALVVFAGMILPMFARTHGDARKEVCKSNLKQIGLAVSLYRNDHDGFSPTRGIGLTPGKDDLRGLGSICLLYDQYITAQLIFRCPSTKDDPCSLDVGIQIIPGEGLITAQPDGCSYAYDSQKARLARLAKTQLALWDVAIASDKPDSANRLRNSANRSNASGARTSL